MSISILAEPQEFQPVYNEVVLVLDSTLKTEESFQFIIDITVNGSYSSRMKVSPNPDGYGVVDMHRHLESYTSYNLDTAATGTFQQMTDSFCKYSVALKEEYVFNGVNSVATIFGGHIQVSNTIPHGLAIGDKVNVTASTVAGYLGITEVVSVVSSTIVELQVNYTANSILTYARLDGATTIIDSSTVMTGDKIAVNAVEDWIDVPNFDYSEYVLSPAPLGQLVSTIPTTNTVKLEDRVYSNFYNNSETGSTYLEVISTNGTFRITNPHVVPIDANRFLTIGVSPYLLNNTTDTVAVVSGSLPIVDAATTSYTVKLINSGFVATSETINFNVDASCNNFEIYRLIYMDQFGSFLNVNFELPTKYDVSTKRTKYLQNYGSYAGGSYGWNSYDRGQVVLDSNITEVYEVSTDWVNNTVSNQVKDLLISPQVYHLDENGLLRAIDIKTSSLRVKNTSRDKVFNYSLKFEYAVKNTRQRG